MRKNPFIGTWRIVHMEEWDNDYLDLVVPAFIKVEKDNSGSFQFGILQGWLDHRVSSIVGQCRGAMGIAAGNFGPSWRSETSISPEPLRATDPR